MIKDDIQFLHALNKWRSNPKKILEFREYLKETKDIDFEEKFILDDALSFLCRDYKLTMIDGNLVEIDLPIFSSVNKLRSLGYKTLYSCGGHLKTPAYIMFDGLYNLQSYDLFVEYNLYRNSTIIRSSFMNTKSIDKKISELNKFINVIKSMDKKEHEIRVEDVLKLRDENSNVVRITNEVLVRYLLGENINDDFLDIINEKSIPILEARKAYIEKNNMNNFSIERLDRLIEKCKESQNMSCF